MNEKQNFVNLIRRKGYERMRVDFSMTPSLAAKFRKYIKETGYKVPPSPFRYIGGAVHTNPKPPSFYRKMFKEELAADTYFDAYGVAYESGSEACMHMRRFHHPLKDATTLEELKNFPYPNFSAKPSKFMKVFYKWGARDKLLIGSMQCTIWETAWYVRSMESLMMDMLTEPEMANYLLDKITEDAIIKATAFVNGGAEALYLGDDIGMQSTIIMSEELYVEYLKPRLKRVIDSVRKIKKDVIIFYHSCGYIEPFIPHLIDVGVDVLNPIQPECMDFKTIFKQYGDKLSFCGTIGTQTLMPYGTPQEIRKYVKETLDFVGEKGGLLICPTHILEPEVPVENIVAFIEACKEYRTKKAK